VPGFAVQIFPISGSPGATLPDVRPARKPVRTGDRLATALVAGATCVLGALYIGHGRRSTASAAWIGVDQWAVVGHAWADLFTAAAAVAGLAVALRPTECARGAATVARALDDRRVRCAVAVAAALACWAARSRRTNLDGSLLQQKVIDGVSRTGAFVTHDEMLELYLHSRLWVVAHAVAGWDVHLTYQVASCVAGGVVAFVALGLGRDRSPARRLLLTGGLVAGGWVLVFFGDVENYSWAGVLAFCYLLAALRYLDDEDARLWPVAGLFALGVLFHLEVLVLGPSLLVLAAAAAGRGRRTDAVASLLVVPGALGAALWWFDRHGLPVTDLFTHSQISAQGGDWSRFLAPLDGRYLWQQVQLLLLLVPVVVLLPAVLADRAHRRHRSTAFLAAASGGALLLTFLWRAQLGPDDWNLFALAAPPVGLLVLRWATHGPGFRARAPWLAALVVLSAAHTAAWVAGNHLATA
jgi:hypothetical protein